MSFTHLHVHSCYSLLDGAARIGELVARAKALGQTALAITDHGVMYGVVEFYKACKKEGVKPIIGMEAYVAPRAMEDREGKQDRDYAHLVLLCKNEVGYHNLIRLSSESFTRGFYYKPRIDYDLLSRHTEGLICLSACLAGDIPQRLLANRYNDAKDMAARLKAMFGEDFYIELQDHGIPEQKKVLPGLVSIANELAVKTVATNDVHYVNREDAEAQDVLLCIQTVRYVDEEDRMRMQTEEFYLKSEAEMRLALPNQPESIDNTAEVADKCDLELSFGGRHLPGFTAPDGMDNESYLRLLCEQGLKRKMPGADDEIRARLDYELSVIINMGFVDYFLIVWDFIHFAKTHGIMVGPGRGSGAGSLAAYCMDITDVDPVKYGLIFERFLNPERISMPDFDVDFCFERRQEVIDYVTDKYGADHVAQIITFGTMAAKGVVRDVARVLRIPYGEADRIAKLVPAELNMTLDRAIALSSELRQEYENNDTVKRLIDLCKRLEGLPRHASTHAAGVVISKLPITDVVPLQKNDESVTTQFPMGTLEEIGLLKMDFLGLRTLTVIRDALAFIREDGKQAPDLSSMEFNDPAVYQLIARGDTDGVFQLESAGMRQFMMQLKPDCFEDIIAGISLFRPGPMAQIPRYVAAKNGAAQVAYSTDKLKPILSATYGCMVYQEQVMQIVRDLAGYSLGRSDLVRRAMSKKKQDVMAQERKNFIHGNAELGVPGAVKNGVPEKVADSLFNEMMDFASYAFNKSHAACYAVVAYHTAYLKLYYPQEFMAALINSYLGSADKVAEYVYAARRMGITVLPPDVNASSARFTVEGGNVRFGLSAIRNVGEGVMQAMVREREQNGSFQDFFNFVERTDGLNKRMLENLIYAGCFDGFSHRRSQLIEVYDSALDASVKSRKVREQGQLSLFDIAGDAGEAMDQLMPKLADVPEFAKHYILEKEREALGVYISGHPLDEYADTLQALPYTVLELQEADGTAMPKDNSVVKAGGLISNYKQKPTKSGNGMMAYASLEGVTGTVELVLFPRALEKLSGVIRPGAAVTVSGKLNIREEQENSVLVDDALPLSQKPKQKTLYLRLPSLGEQDMQHAAQILTRYPGNVAVVLCDAAGTARRAPRSMFVNLSEAFIKTLNECYGKENVKMIEK